MKTLRERFEEKYLADPTTGCWLWTGDRHYEGYGRMRLAERKLRMAHRIAYELYVGPIPGALLVCHRCDTPACVNPAHLFLGTDHDNTRDMMAKGRHPTNGKPQCKRGHPYDKANTYARPDSNVAARKCRRCNAEDARRYRSRKARAWHG